MGITVLLQVASPTRPAVSSLRHKPGDEDVLRGSWAERRIFAHGTFVGMAVQVRSCGFEGLMGIWRKLFGPSAAPAHGTFVGVAVQIGGGAGMCALHNL